MKYLSLLFCVVCLVCSCKQKQHKTISHSKREDSIANEKALWHYADSIRNDFIKSIHEPFIDTYRHEVYRYWYSIVFHQDFIFRLEKINEKWMLISKSVQDECPNCREGTPVIVPGKEQTACYGDIIDTTIQELTPKQWRTFSDLLEGSYYRRLQESFCNDGIMDGSTISLEAKSMNWCGLKDSLTFYQVGIHVPREGSFKEACKYLSRISELTKDKQIQHWIWMY